MNNIAYLEHPQIKMWLEECRREATRKIYSYGIREYFNWYTSKQGLPTDQTAIDHFLGLPQKDKRHVMLTYQNGFTGKDNTVNGILTSVSSFLAFMDMPVNLKGKRRKGQPDMDSHEFSTDDLRRLYMAADAAHDLRAKALLALGTSLGWENGAVLSITREQMQGLITKALASHSEYIYFQSIRRKTGANRLGVLNPLAIQIMSLYLAESEDKKPRKRIDCRAMKFNTRSNLFDLTQHGVNRLLKRFCREANIPVTGRVHWHKIRGWVMSQLSRAGLNEFQIKFLVGKSIPLADSTYLNTLKLEIEERYPQAYETYLCIGGSVTTKTVSKLLREHEEISELREKVSKYQELEGKVKRLETAKPALEALLRKVELLEAQLKNS